MIRRFVHYGSPAFDSERWNEIENDGLWIKPQGGLWASPVGAERSWWKWCQAERFHVDHLEEGFYFTLKKDARILELTPDNIWELPIVPHKAEYLREWRTMERARRSISVIMGVDFERLAQEYDVLECNMSKHPELYWHLYGWDCDCILVLNKNVTRGIENE